jgi:hypothetical protein
LSENWGAFHLPSTKHAEQAYARLLALLAGPEFPFAREKQSSALEMATNMRELVTVDE